MSDGFKPLILTAILDQKSFSFFDDMRQRYFPPARNQVPAHLTLFHNLPDGELASIAATLTTMCKQYPESIDAEVTGPRFLGKGCAYVVSCPSLELLHRDLSKEWRQWLIPQDLQPFHPHIVVQNKADPIEAKRTFDDLSKSFQCFRFNIMGLQLWHYLNGPWQAAARFEF